MDLISRGQYIDDPKLNLNALNVAVDMPDSLFQKTSRKIARYFIKLISFKFLPNAFFFRKNEKKRLFSKLEQKSPNKNYPCYNNINSSKSFCSKNTPLNTHTNGFKDIDFDISRNRFNKLNLTHLTTRLFTPPPSATLTLSPASPATSRSNRSVASTPEDSKKVPMNSAE